MAGLPGARPRRPRSGAVCPAARPPVPPLWPRPARPQGARSPSLAAPVSRALAHSQRILKMEPWTPGLGLPSRCSERGWRCVRLSIWPASQWEPGAGRAGGQWAERSEKTPSPLQISQDPSGWTVPVARTLWSRGQADLTGRVYADTGRGPRPSMMPQIPGCRGSPSTPLLLGAKED